jgi:membrane protein implicated in regulation of membrane protease activity
LTVFWRYWLLQIPGWILLGAALAAASYYLGLSVVFCVLVFLLWLLKDVAFYFWLGKHYELRSEDATRALLGRRAIAREPLAPSGYVELGGELWRAELLGEASVVGEGAEVVVEGIDGLTLRVRGGGGLSASPRPPRAR